MCVLQLDANLHIVAVCPARAGHPMQRDAETLYHKKAAARQLGLQLNSLSLHYTLMIKKLTCPSISCILPSTVAIFQINTNHSLQTITHSTYPIISYIEETKAASQRCIHRHPASLEGQQRPGRPPPLACWCTTNINLTHARRLSASTWPNPTTIPLLDRQYSRVIWYMLSLWY